jgi:hypothetical protein
MTVSNEHEVEKITHCNYSKTSCNFGKLKKKEEKILLSLQNICCFAFHCRVLDKTIITEPQALQISHLFFPFFSVLLEDGHLQKGSNV